MLRSLLRPRKLQPFARAYTSAMASSNPATATSASASLTPIEDAIREKITANLAPTTLTIRNDSHLHAHHAPMRGVTSQETHFAVTIVSSAFEGKSQPARHRMVYSLLKEEMSAEGGIHALQLRTKTVEEEEREREREKEKESGKGE
ncbi:hypothetical protein VTO42DRAFT_7678 [Malbranchea cinnamomea]